MTINNDCEEIKLLTLKKCSIKGNYCYNIPYQEFQTTCTNPASKHISKSKCLNNTIIAELCPNGYYCPNNITKKSCPKGHACYFGASQPRLCPIGGLLCPNEMTSNPSSSAMIITFLLIFTVAIFISKYFSEKVVRYKEKNIDSSTFLESQHQLNETEGEQYKRTLVFLSEKKAEILSFRMSSAQLSSGSSRKNKEPIKVIEDNIERRQRVLAKWRQLIHSKAFKAHVQLMKQREKNLVNKVTGSFSFQLIQNPLTITFDHLSFKLNLNNVTLLDNIYGQFKPYNITALMGSSGAGKTTLLSLLRGQSHNGKLTGDIFVNQQQVKSLQVYNYAMGYVPQDDIMYDELTVSENLKYSAMLFNRRGYVNINEVIPMVHYTMELLGLSFIKHSIVGSASKKGISGGQKKRVSIGMELMKEPSLFFLDEPTSGLDSASSISLMNSLHKISQNGVNIVATLHQPRVEIFDIINNLYLLAPGGRLAYFGAAFGLHNHLYVLGYHCPASSNVCDFVMDVISGYINPIWAKTNNLTVKETVKYICDTNYSTYHPEFERKYTKRLKKKHNSHEPLRGELPRLRNNSEVSDTVSQTSEIDLEEQHPSELIRKPTLTDISTFAIDTIRRVPFFNILTIAFRRQIKIYYRDMDNVIYSKYILIIMGILIGNLFSTVDLANTTMTGSITSSQLAYIISVQNDLLSVFLRDIDIRLREENGGIEYIPLFIGKVLGSSVDLIISPIAFVVGYYPFINSQASFLEYLGIFFLLILSISGLINFCSIMFGRKIAPIVSSGFVIILWTVGGIQITTEDIYASLGPLGVFLCTVSPFQSSFEYQMVSELRSYSEANESLVNIYLTRYSYKLSSYHLDQVYLVLYFILANIIALFMLLWQKDHYKYWRYIQSSYILPIVDKFYESHLYECITQNKSFIVQFLLLIDTYITYLVDSITTLLHLTHEDELVHHISSTENIQSPSSPISTPHTAPEALNISELKSVTGSQKYRKILEANPSQSFGDGSVKSISIEII